MLRPGKRRRFTAPALAGARPLGSAFAPPAKREAPAAAAASAAAPVAAAPALPTARAEDSQEPLYFTVLYTKYAPSKLRKNKTWMDGVLEVRPGRPSRCVLFEDSSRQLAASKLSGSSPGDLGPGSEVLVGGWELEVQERQPRDRFLSGDLFDSATAGAGVAPARPSAAPGAARGGAGAPAPGALRAFRAPLPGPGGAARGRGGGAAPPAPGAARGGGGGATPSAPGATGAGGGGAAPPSAPGAGGGAAGGGASPSLAARPPASASPFAHLPHDPRAPGALCLWHRGEEPDMEADLVAALARTYAQAQQEATREEEEEAKGVATRGEEGEAKGVATREGEGVAKGEGSGEPGRAVDLRLSSRLEAALRLHPPAAVVDPHLSRRLLPHQREGVSFLFRCVSRGGGAILADEMGLGKTLQAIALLWTLLKQGGRRDGGRASAPCPAPCVRKALVVAPTTLVRTWAAECRRWLGSERLRVRTLDPGPEAADVARDFAKGRADAVLLASYEMARTHAPALKNAVGLLVCDEAHRLKASGGSKSLAALASLGAPRRVLLTGTPAQNAPKELFALAEFASPGALGSLAAFERLFGRPIERARDRAASPEEVELGRRRGQELARRVAGVVLRRTAEVQERLLPPCIVRSVFCALSPRQTEAYVALLCGETLQDARKRIAQANAKGKGKSTGQDKGASQGVATATDEGTDKGKATAMGPAAGQGASPAVHPSTSSPLHGSSRRAPSIARLSACAGEGRSVVFRGRGVSSRGGKGGAEALSLLGRLRRICIDASLDEGGEGSADEEGGERGAGDDDENDPGAGGTANAKALGDAPGGKERGGIGSGAPVDEGRGGIGSSTPDGEERGGIGSGTPDGEDPGSVGSGASDGEGRGGVGGEAPRALSGSASPPVRLPSSHPLFASSSKLRVLASIAHAALSSDAAGKIVVVSQYVSALDLAAELFAAMGVGCVRLDGSTPARLRAEAVERFQRQPGGVGRGAAAAATARGGLRPSPPARAFLLSTSAGGAGLTLTAASTLVLMDPHWNPALDAQAMARIWRPGQTRACRIYRLFAAGSIDEKILQRQIRKGEVAGGLGVTARKDPKTDETERAAGSPAGAQPPPPASLDPAGAQPPPPAPLASAGAQPPPPASLDPAGAQPPPPASLDPAGAQPPPPAPLASAGAQPPPPALLARASELGSSELFPLPSPSARQGAASAASLGQFSDEELRELFTFRPDVVCETRDILERSGCPGRFRDERDEHPAGAAGMLGDDDVITAAAREGGEVRFVHVDEIKGNADVMRRA